MCSSEVLRFDMISVSSLDRLFCLCSDFFEILYFQMLLSFIHGLAFHTEKKPMVWSFLLILI